MPLAKFPTQNEWQRLINTKSFPALSERVMHWIPVSSSGEGLLAMTRDIRIRELVLQLQHRLSDVAKSYFLMRYYFEKGIPDEEWYHSPGKDGASIEYLPHFDEEHYLTKEWFDYFADVFYYKLFSSWDIIGHILDTRYRLNIKRVNFSRAIREIEEKDLSLYTELQKIREHPDFESARQIRNDITHNFSPSSPGLSVEIDDTSASVGVRDYIPANEIRENAQSVLELFERTLMCIEPLFVDSSSNEAN